MYILRKRLLYRISKYIDGIDFLTASYGCFGIQYHDNLEANIKTYALFNDIENPKYNMKQKHEQYEYNSEVFYQIFQDPISYKNMFLYESNNLHERRICW